MTHIYPTLPAQNLFNREVFIDLLSAGLTVRNYRFVREAAMVWLSNFPGDLKIGWFYAQSLAGDGKYKQAMPILKGLCNADPEFKEAVESIINVINQGENEVNGDFSSYSLPDLKAHLYALTGEMPYPGNASSWGKELWLARLALSKGRLNLAEESIRRVLMVEPPLPIAAVTHLQFLAANPTLRLENKLAQAKRYRHQWPDCLACGIYLADWLMAGEDSTQAVALIHQVVARDVAGQVANRIWGSDHPYTPLWPEKMELGFDLPVPAEVAAFLGWNRLPDITLSGQDSFREHQPEQTDSGKTLSTEGELNDLGQAPNLVEIPEFAQPPNPKESTRVISEDELDSWIRRTEVLMVAKTKKETSQSSSTEETQNSLPDTDILTELPSEFDSDAEFETLQSVQEEIEQLADRLHIRRTGQSDGRFPIYVVLTLRSKLEAFYGENVAALIQDEMKRLASTISRKRGWGARVFIPDDPLSIKELGIKPPRPGDAWELKLALADLDAELGRKGEMIGALLIVGGPEIVPFHRLPNPLDDPDIDVPSDNPYATRDENYFIPEWPVGRLPGGSDADPRLLVAALRRITAHHVDLSSETPWYRQIVDWVNRWIRPGRRSQRLSFGYSAAIWQQAAGSVFSEIGEPADMYISPPCGLVGDSLEDYLDELDFAGNSHENIPTPIGTFGYFNLHGVVDAVEWFGHRDPLNPSDAPEFPIALRPQDLHATPLGKQGGFPALVFSEACYGAHIEGKTIESALALRFLDSGTLALVGSTCMSYGSIMGSLSAADLLGLAFWRYSQQGFPAGEALRQAKIEMIKQMDQEQGYLDGQDQKTLLSFNLFGDPLAQPLKNVKSRKAVIRRSKPMEHFEIVCDRTPDAASVQAIPDSVLSQVRQIVAQYLPGMSGAHVAFVQEQLACDGANHKCPTSQLEHSKIPAQKKNPPRKDQGTAALEGNLSSTRDLVTLSKQVKSAQGTHPYYAHLTLEHGKLVKLVVSR